jgi:hypothetical protein
MKGLFLLGLVILSAATNLQNEMSASLADLGEHPFGKSMVSLLNMNMKTGKVFYHGSFLKADRFMS